MKGGSERAAETHSAESEGQETGRILCIREEDFSAAMLPSLIAKNNVFIKGKGNKVLQGVDPSDYVNWKEGSHLVQYPSSAEVIKKLGRLRSVRRQVAGQW